MSDPASWLPFIGVLVTALTAAAVALIIDARRRADAARVRPDAGRVAAYAAVLEAGLSATHLIDPGVCQGSRGSMWWVPAPEARHQSRMA